MTFFQRCFIAVIGHAYLKEFSKENEVLRNKLIQVNKSSGDFAFLFKIEELSRQNIDLREEGRSRFKIWSEKVFPHDIEIRTEDEPYQTLHIEDIYPTLIRGRDGKGDPFTVEVESWWKVKVSAFDGYRNKRDFVYYLLR